MIQKSYLIPAVINIWTAQQKHLLQLLQRSGQKAVLGGDARCDSPGHSAKYSSYSTMNLQSGKVVDVQLIQVIEAFVIVFFPLFHIPCFPDDN